MKIGHEVMKWHCRESAVPPLPIEWLVSLFGYRFYEHGQEVLVPTRDPLCVVQQEGDAIGHVIGDTLVTPDGRMILPDRIIDSMKVGSGRQSD